jgi:3-oxoacyl-[acyl-carrier protein] reductase
MSLVPRNWHDETGTTKELVRMAKVALVTGAGVGIGRDAAEKLAQDGFDVAITYLSHPADEVVAAIEAAGRRALALQVDGKDSSAVNRTVATVVEQLGGIDVLVNNVGGLVARHSIAEMTDEHWHAVIDVNLSSAFYFTRAVAPHLSEGGRIINIGSLAGENGGSAGAGAYAASKAGLAGFTRASAKEFGPSGITVNAIAPGFIDDTPFHATFSTAEAQKAMVDSTAVQRRGIPADVSAVVRFLASPDAGFVTGAVIDLNGGSYFS